MRHLFVYLIVCVFCILGCSAPDMTDSGCIDNGCSNVITKAVDINRESPGVYYVSEPEDEVKQFELRLSSDFSWEEMGAIIEAEDKWDDKIAAFKIAVTIDHDNPNVHRSIEVLPGDTGDVETSKAAGNHKHGHITLYVTVIQDIDLDLHTIAVHEIGHWLGHPHHEDSKVMASYPKGASVLDTDIERLCTEYRDDC